MKISFTGRHLDSSDAFVSKLDTEIESLCNKYGLSPIDATGNLYRVGHGTHHFRLDVSLHLSKGLYIRSHSECADAYNALTSLMKSLELKLRRHKKRLEDHHRRRDQHTQPMMAPSYVLHGNDEEDKALAPPTIAEMVTEIPRLSVADAVMRLDFADDPFLIFLHSGHGGINVIHRRSDGNIGWIDPSLKPVIPGSEAVL